MIGIVIKATSIKNETKNNFIFKILVFIFLSNSIALLTFTRQLLPAI